MSQPETHEKAPSRAFRGISPVANPPPKDAPGRLPSSSRDRLSSRLGAPPDAPATSTVEKLIGLFALLALLATWFCGVFFAPLVAVLYLLQLRTLLTLFILLIATSYAIDAKQSPKFVQFILYMAHWFKHATMHVEPEVASVLDDPGSLWCCHPHGLLMFSFILNGATRIYAGDEKDYLPGLVRGKGWKATGVGEPLLWRLPFIRTFLQLMGCVEPAAHDSFKNLLRRRIPFGILPGGSEEIILLVKGKERVYIKERKGFIKYALQVGYTLVIGYGGIGSANIHLKPINRLDPVVLSNLCFVPLLRSLWRIRHVPHTLSTGPPIPPPVPPQKLQAHHPVDMGLLLSIHPTLRTLGYSLGISDKAAKD